MAEWNLAEVGDWLRSITPAYAQYCAAFAENGVDGSTLLELSPPALKELGVALEVHRARLMVDIKRHRSSASSAAAVPLASSSSNSQPMTPRGECRSIGIIPFLLLWVSVRLCLSHSMPASFS